MMFVDQLATEADVTRLLGDVDALTISRILAIAPSRDELDEALREVEDATGFGEEPRTPSTARVASVRAVIEDLIRREQEDQVEAEAQR
jgi:hypothetical protein